MVNTYIFIQLSVVSTNSNFNENIPFYTRYREVMIYVTDSSTVVFIGRGLSNFMFFGSTSLLSNLENTLVSTVFQFGICFDFLGGIILSGAWSIFPAQCSGVTSGGAKQTMQYQELNPLLLLVKSPGNSLPALPSLGCLYFFFKFISFMFEIFYSFCLFVLFAPYLVALKHYSWILLRNDSDRLWGPYGMPGQNLSKANNLSAVVLLQT